MIEDQKEPDRQDGTGLKALSPPLLAFLQAGLKVNFPPAGFDPRKATDGQLREFFLPPRPDRGLAPRAFANWERAMSGPPVWPVMPPQEQLFEALFAESQIRSRPRLAGTVDISQEASTNWSGAYVRPRDFSPMSRVQGMWTAPNPDPPTPQPGTYASSAWVGLDGHDPASRSLPQIGTGHWVTVTPPAAPKRHLFAWWQWFVRDWPHNGQIIIKPLPVSANNVIYAQVQALASNKVSLFIINLSSNVAFPAWFTVVPPNQGGRAGPNPLPPHVEGRTAEWILERPAHLHSTALYDLANYGHTAFQECHGGTGPWNNIADLDLARARLIRMAAWGGNKAPGTVVSVPTRIGNDGLGMQYVV